MIQLTAQDVAERLVGEVRRDVEDLQKKRKKDRAAVDMEIKAHKKQMSGVSDSADGVLRNLERLAGVLEVLLESERVQAALEHQDLIDRKNVSLMGFRGQRADGEPAQEGSNFRKPP